MVSNCLFYLVLRLIERRLHDKRKQNPGTDELDCFHFGSFELSVVVTIDGSTKEGGSGGLRSDGSAFT